MEIHAPKDCDNAPKRRTIRDFIISYSGKDAHRLLTFLAGEFIFLQAGDREITDKEDLTAHVRSMAAVKKLYFEQIITHGKFGAANGRLITSRNTGFAYFFEFKSAGSPLIRKITAYLV